MLYIEVGSLVDRAVSRCRWCVLADSIGPRISTIEAGDNEWWAPLVEFAVHVTVGTAIFLVIAVPAVLLDLATGWLKAQGLHELISGGLVGMKFVLFGLDLALFMVYLANASWKFLKKLEW